MISLGCAKNLVDSEVLMRQLEANRFRLAFDPTDIRQIDSVVINTCGFIGDAKQESIDTILEYALARQQGTISHLYVMGCLSERYVSTLRKEITEVDEWFGVNDLKKIITHLGGTYRTQLLGDRYLTTPPHYAYLKIAEGCDRRCSFCAIPGIRGKHLSRPMEDILMEAGKLAEKGVKEINVISQDTTYYGLDLYKKRRLPELLRQLAAVPGLEWIRVHYAYPDGFPADLMKVIRSHENICRYIDIPLQHISDRILRSMRRGLGGTSTRRLVEKIRKEIPGVAIRTTFIAGYPGETAAEHRELMEFIRESRFERVGVFPYSHEEDTHAYTLKDSISARLKEERTGELMSLQEEISHSLNLEKVGTEQKVIIDRSEGEFFVGRTEYDSPEVDNEVLIRREKRDILPGTFARVRITGADSFDLFADLL
ncbi:MAG TPA: 30S ribosomal protein S12 methylthiotransferase RimO [Bacteroidales bacterium]|nr:30S ribosomal protein S12 methylthiotransferase RimO [Bacteroidales bacterium]